MNGDSILREVSTFYSQIEFHTKILINKYHSECFAYTKIKSEPHPRGKLSNIHELFALKMQRFRRAALKMQMSIRKKSAWKIHARLLCEIILLLYAKRDAYVKREKTATGRLFRKVTCRKICVARPLNTRLIIIQSSTISAAILYIEEL